MGLCICACCVRCVLVCLHVPGERVRYGCVGVCVCVAWGIGASLCMYVLHVLRVCLGLPVAGLGDVALCVFAAYLMS